MSLRLSLKNTLRHVPFAKSCSVEDDKYAPSFLMLPLGSKMGRETYVNLFVRPVYCKTWV